MSRFLPISAILFLLCAPAYLSAQDQADVPLGDLARELRTSAPPEQSEVIDNDNLDTVMDKAESERLEGKPIFSTSASGIFTAVSPDGTCSLTFDAKSVNRISAAYIATDLPQNVLADLDGPALIHDGELQVSVHNNTDWGLKEIVVALTLVQAQSVPAEYRFATLEAASSTEKLQDSTLLYHLKGTAPPGSISTFRAQLIGNFPQSRDWRWAIVGARGIPPAAQATDAAQSANQSLPANNSALASSPSNTDTQSISSPRSTLAGANSSTKPPDSVPVTTDRLR